MRCSKKVINTRHYERSKERFLIKTKPIYIKPANKINPVASPIGVSVPIPSPHPGSPGSPGLALNGEYKPLLATSDDGREEAFPTGARLYKPERVLDEEFSALAAIAPVSVILINNTPNIREYNIFFFI